jgi:hypothetical protein
MDREYTESAADSSGLSFYESTEAWQTWFESRLADERGYTSALITEVVRDLVDDLHNKIERAIVEVRLAAKVQDGRDGRGFTVRGTWDPNARYFALDVVACGGSSFAARRDDPGICPGDGWQMIAAQGKRGTRGEPGERGLPGPRGRDAPTICEWSIDRGAYKATPIMSDGTCGPALELRGLFEKFLEETSS